MVRLPEPFVRPSVPAHQDNPFRRFMRWTGSIKPMSLFYARTLHHLDRRVYQLTRGRTTFAAWASGLPVIMLETTGAKSGQKRTLPVIGLPDGEDLFVIASNYGQDRHPSWYHNLKAHPRARVTVDGASREVEAFEVTDRAERERLYEQASRAVIVFPAYKKRTDAIGRRIPIMRLK
jgi:deazaflavin-dependent oxidoreductase (nitroreductase family)